MKIVSLFSGCGGMDLGFLGGFSYLGNWYRPHDTEIIFANDFDKKCCETYGQNFEHPINCGDVYSFLDLIPKADIVIGGFPCQDFSVAGKRKGFDSPRGTLYKAMVEAVRIAEPEIFVAENVKGLLSVKGALDTIKADFAVLGYTVTHTLVNAKNFGIPQNRERVIIVGSKSGNFVTINQPCLQLKRPIDLLEKEPDASAYFSPKAWAGALNHKLRHTEKGTGFGFRLFDESKDVFPTITSHYGRGGTELLINQTIFTDVREGESVKHSWDLQETTQRQKDICLTLLRNRRKKQYGPKDGNALEFDDLAALVPDLKIRELWDLVHKNILVLTANDKWDLKNSKQSSGIEGVYKILSPDTKLFPTVTASQVYHVGESVPRRLSVLECSRIQSFPDTFKHHKTMTTAYKQIGNAVPPVMAWHIAKQVIGEIK